MCLLLKKIIYIEYNVFFQFEHHFNTLPLLASSFLHTTHLFLENILQSTCLDHTDREMLSASMITSDNGFLLVMYGTASSMCSINNTCQTKYESGSPNIFVQFHTKLLPMDSANRRKDKTVPIFPVAD